MAILVKHSKVSAIPDDADTSLIRPSDWNADHTLTGTIDIANGGTGQTTANAAFNALVPSQTGNTGKYLTTNGTDTSWATNPLGTVTSVAATAGTGISVTGSPITTSGTLNITNTAPDQTVVLNSGTGISTSGTYPNFTVTNTAPDQTVSIASGTGISATGTYPAFTVANTGVTSAVAGTGISVSGSTGAVTVTNTAPDQTVALTGAGTTVVTGTYPNFTITSTDSTTGTVTSVAATVPAFLSVSGSPITTSGTLALTYSGTALPVANGGTARTVGNYSVFANEIHVSKDGNDTTGDGTLINPVLTITKALTLIAGLKKTVIVHAGDYPESPTVSTANTTIATSELTGANTTISGTLTLSAAARVSGIKISNLTITGSGNTYISNCTVDTQVVKSGTNYVEIINTELQCVSGVQITGAGTVSIVGNKCWAVAVSNASANVLIKDCFQVLTPSVTAGTLQIDGSAIFASSPASNAVTSSVGSFITLANSFILNSAGTNVERVSLAGSYSILNLVYDKTNSTFTGTNLNAIDYFSVINADTLVLTNDLAIAYGGTNSSATPTAGAVPYGTGTAYGFSAAGTAGQVLTSQGAGTPTWTTPTTGTVTSVTGTAPVVSSGGNTPAISMAQATTSVDGYLSSTDWTTFNSKGNGTVTSVAALTLGTTGTDLSSTVANGTTTPVITLNVPTASATNRGALSSADWTTFNNKAAPFTYTSTYIPFGQGTTTPNQSANLTFDGTSLTAPVQRASNGIVTNNKTIGTSFTIPATDNAMSSGPVTISSGVTVTVSSGSRWVVL